MKRINSLQDLRGIAILMVLLFHAGGTIFGDYSVFMYGKKGVQLFFVISGFILYYIHKDDTGLDKFLSFAKKKIQRIHYPYIPVFLLFTLLFSLTGKGADYHRNIINIIRNFLLIQDPRESIHPYSWFLVYEMFYYFSFSVIFILLRRRLVFYVSFLIIPTIAKYFFIDYINGFEIITSSNNFYFAAGILISKYYSFFKFNVSRVVLILTFISFLAIPFIVESDALLLLPTALFFIFYIVRDESFLFLKIVGNASYSIYLLHALVISIGKQFLPVNSFLSFATLILFSLALGFAYYYIVEKHIIRFNNRNVRKDEQK